MVKINNIYLLVIGLMPITTGLKAQAKKNIQPQVMVVSEVEKITEQKTIPEKKGKRVKKKIKKKKGKKETKIKKEARKKIERAEKEAHKRKEQAEREARKKQEHARKLAQEKLAHVRELAKKAQFHARMVVKHAKAAHKHSLKTVAQHQKPKVQARAQKKHDEHVHHEVEKARKHMDKAREAVHGMEQKAHEAIDVVKDTHPIVHRDSKHILPPTKQAQDAVRSAHEALKKLPIEKKILTKKEGSHIVASQVHAHMVHNQAQKIIGKTNALQARMRQAVIGIPKTKKAESAKEEKPKPQMKIGAAPAPSSGIESEKFGVSLPDEAKPVSCKKVKDFQWENAFDPKVKGVKTFTYKDGSKKYTCQQICGKSSRCPFGTQWGTAPGTPHPSGYTCKKGENCCFLWCQYGSKWYSVSSDCCAKGEFCNHGQCWPEQIQYLCSSNSDCTRNSDAKKKGFVTCNLRINNLIEQAKSHGKHVESKVREYLKGAKGYCDKPKSSGQTCYADSMCASGLNCRKPNYGGTDCKSATDCTCQKLKGEGGSCSNDYTCASGLFCAAGKCKKNLPEFSPCIESKECGSGMKCYGGAFRGYTEWSPGALAGCVAEYGSMSIPSLFTSPAFAKKTAHFIQQDCLGICLKSSSKDKIQKQSKGC